MKNPTDFGKTVETGVDPCVPNSRVQHGGRRCQSGFGYPLTTKLVRAKLALIRILMLC